MFLRAILAYRISNNNYLFSEEEEDVCHDATRDGTTAANDAATTAVHGKQGTYEQDVGSATARRSRQTAHEVSF